MRGSRSPRSRDVGNRTVIIEVGQETVRVVVAEGTKRSVMDGVLFETLIVKCLGKVRKIVIFVGVHLNKVKFHFNLT